MENITIKINGMEVSAPKGSTILEAARLAHIEIPTLCFLKEINEIGACRICVVEVKGARSLVVSCVYRSTKAWKYGPTPQRYWSPAEKPCSFCFPTMTANAYPASAAETASCSSSVRSSALPMKTITMVSAPRPSSMTAPFT